MCQVMLFRHRNNYSLSSLVTITLPVINTNLVPLRQTYMKAPFPSNVINDDLDQQKIYWETDFHHADTILCPALSLLSQAGYGINRSNNGTIQHHRPLCFIIRVWSKYICFVSSSSISCLQLEIYIYIVKISANPIKPTSSKSLCYKLESKFQ